MQVNPGSNATGYVSNVEGVINRFVEVINMVLRDLKNEITTKLNDTETVNLSSSLKEIEQLESLLNRLTRIGQDDHQPFTLELLDPHGHSMIIDESASERELSDEEIISLPTGPDPAVFSA